MLQGKHLIAGQWFGTEDVFFDCPTSGSANAFALGSAGLVDQACLAAEAAFESYANSTRAERAVFLRSIGEEIEVRAEQITRIGCQETGLPEARLNGERARTIGQLELFADHIEAGRYLDSRRDEALPGRSPLPRPDLRLIQRPVGPVAVFGASNFPLAFSAAGGDTAAALAAGCPVVMRGHSAHPGVSDLVAQAISAALSRCGLHPGVFNLVQGGGHAVGQSLVQHRLIKAVGFTGSLRGGRALFDLCAARPEPIPFFGELGSVNPMFLLPQALAERGDGLAAGWAGSLTMGAGQFCTNPGIAVLVGQPQAAQFIAASRAALAEVAPQFMLTSGIAEAFQQDRDRMAALAGVTVHLLAESGPRQAAPALLSTSAKNWLQQESLQEEVFGTLGMVVVADDLDEMMCIAKALQGQLTCTVHMADEDAGIARALLPVLERKAGRVLFNGFPTGVEVSDAMVHGGPYPASTNFGATSVGTLSIRRFLRPVCYRDLPAALRTGDLA